MWINREMFERNIAEKQNAFDKMYAWQNTCHNLQGQIDQLRGQKIKDDLNIDWMRHRVNALEKQNAILIAKAAGVHFPVPEIVPVAPGTMTVPDFSSMPTFEDVGDEEARRIGAGHDSSGTLVFNESDNRE